MRTLVDGAAHSALLYRDAAELLAGVVPFLLEGLAEGAVVGAALPGPHLDLVRSGLGRFADQVRLFDMAEVGRNPGRILAEVIHTIVDSRPDAPARIVDEPVWAGRSDREYPACVQHEALINAAFAERTGAILCPYDVAGLDPQVIEDAYRTHPVVATPAAREVSQRYGDPVAVARSFNLPLPEPPVHAATIVVDFGALAKVRAFVAEAAESAGLSADRTADLVIAVNELATNTAAHTPGTGTLAVWTEGGDIVCQVRDGGYIDAPLAGRIPPPSIAYGGRGLILVNQLCDLVRVHTRPGATTVRLHMRLT